VSVEPDTDVNGSAVAAYRISYLSSGHPVTGLVLAPLGDPPEGGWPIVSWDHGTTGMADRCAPSRSKDLGGVALGLIPLVQTGYVVAATDYPGLGTEGLHPWLDGTGEGRATIDIVRAARHVVPGASTHWFAVGHSQGGHAALFAGQLAPSEASDLDLLGVVAVAPASQLPLFVNAVGTRAQTFLAMLAASVAATDPSVPLDTLLSPGAMAKADVFDSGCNNELGDAFGSLDPLLAPGAATNPAFVDYLQRNDPGHQPIAAPVLVVQGGADTTVLPQLTDALVQTMCGRGDTVELKRYPSSGHTDVLIAALGDIRTFLTARVAGTPGTKTC
jgi:alpha-beta hydrolase superfamily lysophospholipase